MVYSVRKIIDCEAVSGLETHIQFKPKSKLGCGCANAFGSPPNTNVCPVCLGCCREQACEWKLEPAPSCR